MLIETLQRHGYIKIKEVWLQNLQNMVHVVAHPFIALQMITKAHECEITCYPWLLIACHAECPCNDAEALVSTEQRIHFHQSISADMQYFVNFMWANV